MPVSKTNVLLYAATPHDFQMALGASAIAGVPATNVAGDFTVAWNAVHDGSKLVLAVGGAALNALYYNPCNWIAPNHQPGGHTPFTQRSGPVDFLPGANVFVNGAGALATDTYKLAAMLTYYAVNGHYPNGYGPLPHAIDPTSECARNSVPQVPCPCK